MSVNFSPIGNGAQFFTSGGVPLAGGLLWTYAAGTSTPLNSYTTSAGSIANSNPIVLGSDGRPPSEIWLTSGSAYKFVLMDSLSSTLSTYDNITGINDFNNLSLPGALTVAGNTTLTNLSVTGNTTIGDASGDALIIYPAAINWVNNPTHNANHTFSGNVSVGGTLGVTGTASFAVAAFSAIPTGKVTASTYAPTISNVANLTSNTPHQCFYTRVGDIVTVCGAFDATTTAGGGAVTTARLTLPIASDLATLYDLSGTFACISTAQGPGTVQGNAISNAADVSWFSNSATTVQINFSFMYLVI